MQEPADRGQLAEIVRQACIAAAIEGYEDASMRGLCREGAWEAAVSAIRRLDVAALAESPSRAPKAR